MRINRRVFVSPVIVATLAATAAFADSNPSSMRQPQQQQQQQQVEERGMARPVQTAPKIVFVNKTTARKFDDFGYESDVATLTFKNVGNTPAKGDGYNYTLTYKAAANGTCWNGTGKRGMQMLPGGGHKSTYEPGPDSFPDVEAGATFQMKFEYVDLRDPRDTNNKVTSCSYDMTINNDGKQTNSSITFPVPGQS